MGKVLWDTLYVNYLQWFQNLRILGWKIDWPVQCFWITGEKFLCWLNRAFSEKLGEFHIAEFRKIDFLLNRKVFLAIFKFFFRFNFCWQFFNLCFSVPVMKNWYWPKGIMFKVDLYKSGAHIEIIGSKYKRLNEILRYEIWQHWDLASTCLTYIQVTRLIFEIISYFCLLKISDFAT